VVLLLIKRIACRLLMVLPEYFPVIDVHGEILAMYYSPWICRNRYGINLAQKNKTYPGHFGIIPKRVILDSFDRRFMSAGKARSTPWSG